jgi:hypothetical protein
MFSGKRILGLLLLAAIVLLVLPTGVAARTPTINDIQPGDTVFVYEESLNVAALNTSTSSYVPPNAFKKFGNDCPSPTSSCSYTGELAVIPCNPDGTLSVYSTPAYLGTWYAVNTTTGDTNRNSNINIRVPDATLDVVLANSPTTSVKGSGVTRSTPIQFRVDSQYVGVGYVANGVPQATYNIEVTTPAGGHLTQLGNTTLSGYTMVGLRNYTAPIDLSTVEAGQYTAVLKWQSPSEFFDNNLKSNQITFSVASKVLTITCNKETVVRGGNFVITIHGESASQYRVFVKDNTTDSPIIPDGQVDISNITAGGTSATIKTDSSGAATVMFETSAATDDETFTIRVEDPSDSSKYDSVDITVIKGAVTVTAEGTGTYYFGEVIKLSGSNSETDNVYLFITGPNLNTNGVRLDQINMSVDDEDASTFKTVSVDADNEWDYKWDTGSLGGNILDAGSYTLYATSSPYGARSLSDTTYSSMSVQFNKAYISIHLSANTVAAGDKFSITGTASGKPSAVYVWIFGKNYHSMFNVVSVESDNTYEFKLDSDRTEDMYYGQYFVVVQHPMANGAGVCAVSSSGGDCKAGPICHGTDTCSYIAGNPDYYTSGTVMIAGLQSNDAATALIDALATSAIDDTYAKATFTVDAPFIRLSTVSDRTIGSNVTLTGSTNLAVGDKIQIDVTSASFQPTKKTQTGEFSGVAGMATVETGNPYNVFTFQFDTATFREDEYIVTASAVQTGTSATTMFNLFINAPTPVPTTTIQTTIPTPQTPVTVITTIPPTPTPTPKKTIPGFGTAIALIGLGVVAFMVMRKNK